MAIAAVPQSTTGVLATRESFARISEVLPIPNLIDVQTRSFQWFMDEGLKELFAEISPITDFTGKNLELHFLDYTVRPAEVLRVGVPRAGHDLLGSAAGPHPAGHQGDRRDQGAGDLHGRLPDDDRHRHVHHQRRRARRRLPARALAGRLLHAGDRPDDRAASSATPS